MSRVIQIGILKNQIAALLALMEKRRKRRNC